jgi:hypothetical protein
MIVLNSNKELIRVENWADIEARPGFTSDLDPKNHELASIIGRYAFSDRIRCGLSNCHTPHAKGYVVATKDGHETNIGKDCGKNYFGVDFETLTRQFDQDITDKENRERLWSFSFRAEELKNTIQKLRTEPTGADWVFHSTRPLVEAGRTVPGEVVRRITSMIKNRQSVVVIEREATEEEAEQLEAARGKKLPRPQYVDEPIGQLDGMECLYPENDLRQLLVIEVEQELRSFEEQKIDALNSAALTRWNKWASSVDLNIERAIAAVEAGRRLLRAENLRPLLELVKDKEQSERMAKYIKSIVVARAASQETHAKSLSRNNNFLATG